MLYELKKVSLSLNGKEIIKNSNFRMVDNEKIGIVGRNGAGKTTLLRMILNEIDPDYNDDNTKCEIIKSSDFNPSYLSQIVKNNTDLNIKVIDYLKEAYSKVILLDEKIKNLTKELEISYDDKKISELNKLIDEFNLLDGGFYEKEIKKGFVKFGFDIEELQKNLSSFSGGQITKISLLKLLLSKPNVLILDEPTNHLDIMAVEWMEAYLKKYKKNIIVVSHDRMFLDNICNVIYEVENKMLTRYDGNYSDFVNQKNININLEKAKYEKNVKEIERLSALADRFRYKATKASMVKSKEKIIDKIEKNLILPRKEDNSKIHYHIIPKKVSGKEVLKVKDLVIGYIENNNEKLISKVSFEVKRKDRIGIIGKNGTGKSTLLKTLVGIIPKINGEINYGSNVEFEYFDQQIALNNSTKTVFDDYFDCYNNYTNTEIRNKLAMFLFNDEDIDKKVCDLSGGEKVRLCLAKIFERQPNLLFLDEPTNHLDIIGKESLETILDEYDGTVIFVSHDRYFTNKIANKILLFEDKKTLFFDYGYDDFLRYENNNEIKDNPTNIDEIIRNKEYKNKVNYDSITNSLENEVNMNNNSCENIEEESLTNKEIYLFEKEQAKLIDKIDKLELKITELENKNKELLNNYNNPQIQNDYCSLQKIQSEIDENKEIINEYMLEWEDIQSKIRTY